MSPTAIPDTPLQRVKTLNAILQVARHAYYVDSDPIITDLVYDAHEAELKRLVSLHPQLAVLATVLTTVGSDLVVGTLERPIKHSRPMLSLDNKYTDEEVLAWLATIPDEATYVLEPKVDGLSLCVRFQQWHLWLATTRGDGLAGEDVTAAALNIKDIPHTISRMLPHDLEVRGEVALTRQQFAALNEERGQQGLEPFKTSRNTASGAMKLKDTKEVAHRGLSFFPWQIIGEEPKSWVPDTTEEILAMGANNVPPGFEHSQALEWYARQTRTRSYQGFRCYKKEFLLAAIQQAKVLKDGLWAELIGDCDGVVVKVQEQHIREQLGEATNKPRWAIAYKFPAEQAVTTLEGITWQVGRTGKVTPVAELAPVLCGGTTNRRGGLCNVTYLLDKGVAIGDKVFIHRGGEVIPQIDGVAEPGPNRVPVEIPTTCPACGDALLDETGKPTKENPEGVRTLTCVSLFCPGRLTTHLTYMASRACLDIEGMGDVMAEQLVAQGIAYNLGSLWEWANDTETYLLSQGEEALQAACADAGFGYAAVLDVIRGCAKAKTASWDAWLMALGIPGVAKELSKGLAAFLSLQSEDLPNLVEKLQMIAPKQVEGLGIEKLKEIFAWSNDPRAQQCLQQLHDAGVRPKCTVELKEGPQPLAGTVLCITGDLGAEREHLQKQLASLGAVCKSGVSKKCNLLLVGNDAGRNKIAKAQELGIKQEGKEWLLAVFAAAGLTLESSGADEPGEAFPDL